MTSYKNFISDFPSRCQDIWDTYKDDAVEQNRAVTLMLAVAAAGFVVPFERLCVTNHPSGDATKFAKAAEAYNQIKDKPFIGSQFWNLGSGSWLFFEKTYPQRQSVDQWLEGITLETLRTKTVEYVLKILRNSIAHGGVFNPQTDPQIHTLRFVDYWECPKQNPTNFRYRLITVTPDDFGNFLTSWFQFCKSLNLDKAQLPLISVE